MTKLKNKGVISHGSLALKWKGKNVAYRLVKTREAKTKTNVNFEKVIKPSFVVQYYSGICGFTATRKCLKVNKNMAFYLLDMPIFSEHVLFTNQFL